MRRRVQRFLAWTALTFAMIILALWAAVLVLKPGPEGRIIVATGGAGGAYNELALRYKEELKRYGVELVLRPATEGTNTIDGLMRGADSDINAGFIKGGASGARRGRLASSNDVKLYEGERATLRSLGRLFHEPIWVFYSGSTQVKSLREFKGRRIMIGAPTAGTRLVVQHLLQANGVNASNATLINEELGDDGAALRDGRADVAFVIQPPDSKKIQALLRRPGLYLMNFAAEAEAYLDRFPFLHKLVLNQGGVEFDPEIPSADITLLATSPALVIRRDLHPALASLLAYAVLRRPKPAFDADGEPIMFHREGTFPDVRDPEYRLASEAESIYKAGELPLFLRGFAPFAANTGLPFWLTAFLHAHGSQSILVLIPLLSILLPLSRLLPSLYNWSMRRRLLYWYRELKALEATLADSSSANHLAAKQAEFDRIDRGVGGLRVPLAFSNQLYDLRLHIDLVRQRLGLRASGQGLAVAAG